MSYDILLHGTFGGRPAYRIQLYVRRDQTDTANNRSSYAWELRAQKTATGTTYTNSAYPFQVSIGGVLWGWNAASLSFPPNGSQGNDNVVASGTTPWYAHDADGNLNIVVAAWYHTDGNELFGNADIGGTWFYTDRIPKPPGATLDLWPGANPDQATQTSLRYRFSGSSDGGSAIDAWEAQRATNSAFTTGVQTVSSGGTTTFTGLTPRTKYWFRSRGHNAYGWGEYGAVVSGDTVDLPDQPSVTLTSKTKNNIQTAVVDPSYTGGGITARETQLSPSSAFTVVAQTITTATPNFTGLTRATPYYIRTRVQNSTGWSAWSTTLAVTTDADTPSTPTGYAAHDIASTTAWSSLGTILDNGGAALTQLNYQINTAANPTGATDVTLDSAREPMFTGPAGSTRYYRLRVYNGQLWSAWGDWVSFTFKNNVPHAPTGLAVSGITDTSATVQWVAPATLLGSTITGYRVFIGTNKGLTAGTQQKDVTAAELSAVFTGLTPNTQHYARVIALSNNGDGSSTDILGFVTTNTGGTASPEWENVGGTWKRITRWENVLGTWKQITYWEKIAGVWRQS